MQVTAKAVVDEEQIQKAIFFLAEAFDNRGLNSKTKPVAFHSVRVGMLLWDNGASQDSIVAGFLHDLLEDSRVTKQEIAQNFGNKIAEIVDSLTFDHDATNYKQKLENAKESFDKSLKIGVESLNIRACDLVDNSKYYHASAAPELKEYLHKKYVTFMDLAEEKLKGGVFWELLKQKFEENVKQLA